jgi:hypothetical protein
MLQKTGGKPLSSVESWETEKRLAAPRNKFGLSTTNHDVHI